MSGESPKSVRCSTRAWKNAQHLQRVAPQAFASDPAAAGFGTGVPIELLRGLHRLRPDDPVLNRHAQIADAIRRHPAPIPGQAALDPLFSGTIHFARVTFKTSGGDIAMPTAAMKQVVKYAQRAIGAISEYAAQYGPNHVTIAPTLLAYTANVPNATYTDADLQHWVDDMATANGLSSDSCIFVVSPDGVSAKYVDPNSGYHGNAHVPYIVAGISATHLTIADHADVYAMVVSHEIAEMIVDPKTVGGNPEVCDPCDLNCGNLTRCYFNRSGTYLGANQHATPGGFTFAYYVCAVVKPAGASNCPAAAADCAYAP
jgi:hypothetical protein